MNKVDQFESVFRSAVHEVFVAKEINLKTILVVSDLDIDEHHKFEVKIKAFSNFIDTSAQWMILSKNDYLTTQDLIDKITKLQPELIYTYRNLHSTTWQFSHSLGEYLDVLIQKTNIPIVVLPHPLENNIKSQILKNTDVVMAITDHLSSDDDLVNYAVKFTPQQGKLYLMHIEDANTFDYYMNAISKIATINTDDAQQQIAKQLLKAPENYIQSVETILKENNSAISIEKIIGFGQHLTKYRHYIAQHEVDLLVMNTKNKEQMAMHGLAYPLVIELRTIPLLLI